MYELNDVLTLVSVFNNKDIPEYRKNVLVRLLFCAKTERGGCIYRLNSCHISCANRLILLRICRTFQPPGARIYSYVVYKYEGLYIFCM